MSKDQSDSRPRFRKSPPDGVIEVTGVVGRGCSLVERRDGSLLAAIATHQRTSTDGGLTWSDPIPLPEGVMGNGLLRLQSGALALTSGDSLARTTNNRLWISNDEGQTWEARANVPLLGFPYPNTMIQLANGRLVFPSRIGYSNGSHPELLGKDVVSYGTWRGHRRDIAGHYHCPEIDIASVSYSDDEGKTWQRCNGDLMGWFDEHGIPNGFGGVTACDEPSVAETKDGRVLFFARSTVGRIVQSYSRDDGATWSAVRPTDLASSYSPPYLARIPKTGDLLCVWNQVSREEIRRGYRRGRLSVALSEDSGMSWKNFKTLEVSAGLEDVDRIPPEYPVKPVIALRHVGELPDDFAVFRYANICFAADKVYIMYVREWFVLEENEERQFETADPYKVAMGREQVLRIYPLEYFYT